MSFLDFLSGIAMPSDPLGNNGFGVLTGRLPFLGRGRIPSADDAPGLTDPASSTRCKSERIASCLATWRIPQWLAPWGRSPLCPALRFRTRTWACPRTTRKCPPTPTRTEDAGFDTNGSPLPPSGIGERDRLFTPTAEQRNSSGWRCPCAPSQERK
jgi:hypothetical protein